MALVVATVLPLALLITGGVWFRWNMDQATAISQAIGEARLLAAQIDDHIGNLDNLLTGLAEAVSTDPRDIDANDDLLKRVKGELPDYVANISVLTPDGTSIGTSGTGRHVSAAGRAFLMQVLAGRPVGIGDAMRGPVSGRWIVNVARPIKNRAGTLKGVITVGTWLERFQEALRLQDLPPGAVVTVVDQNGVVLARSASGAQWIGRNISSWSSLAKHRSEREGSFVSVWSQSDAVERVTAFTAAHDVPWTVLIGLPKATLFSLVAFRFAMASLFVSITLAIGFSIAWVLSGRLISPLQQLGADAARLASGEFSHRSTVRSGDEVETLAHDFNRMAAALEARAKEATSAADEMRQTKDTLAAVIDASPVAIVCCDLERKTMLWNRTAEEMFGYSAAEVIGKRSLLTPADGAEGSQNLFERALAGETMRSMEGTRLRKNGTPVHVRVAAAPMYNPDGSVRGVARAYEDIGDSKRAQEALMRLAHYDPLTGLPNRLSLQKELGRLLQGCRQNPVAIALFDLDGFKDVNDTLGHSTGDELLIEVCQRFNEVSASLPRPAMVCRLGGDEFVIIVANCGDPRAIAEIVDLILQRLKDPFDVNGNVLHLGGSAGIAIAPNDAVQADELIANADLALYQAKSEGGQSYRFYLPALRARAQARRGLGIELRRAYAKNEFELHYQPQIRLSDNAVVGAEALLRWRHPERGLIAPAVFIDALAESSIAPDVGRWILSTACAQTAAWQAGGLALNRIGVNLFPDQAHDPDLIREVADVLAASGLNPGALELEITENAALNIEDPNATLRKVQDLGVRLAFDDFGTGYASLNHLTRFPIWRIKIDRTFVARITNSAEDAAIVRSLIAMAHNLGLRVVAEGVETEAQAAFLLKESCEEAQGYLFGRPVAAADFATYLRSHRIAHEDVALQSVSTRGAPASVQVAPRRKLRRI